MSAPRPDDVCLISCGARTPVGLTAPAAAAAVRAGLAAFGDHPFMIERHGLPMIVARDAALGADVEGPDRLLALLRSAAAEAFAGIGLPPSPPVPWLVALPPARPGQPEALGKDLIERLSRDKGVPAPPAAFPCGHAGGFLALAEASRRIRSGEAELCLVAGVDSYHAPETLEWLDGQEQLKSEEASSGFIPGEAAGAWVVTSRRRAQKGGWPVRAVAACFGSAREEHRIGTDGVCLGRGLTEALRMALEPAVAEGAKVAHTYCDLNGQPYRADEFGYSVTRVGKHFADATDFTAPADCWGDVGAATGPLLLLLAAESARQGAAKGPWAMSWTSSDGGERSAALVRLEGPGTGR